MVSFRSRSLRYIAIYHDKRVRCATLTGLGKVVRVVTVHDWRGLLMRALSFARLSSTCSAHVNVLLVLEVGDKEGLFVIRAVSADNANMVGLQFLACRANDGVI